MLIVLGLVAGYPLVSTMYYSLTDRLLIADHQTQFVGFNNYLYYGPNLNDYDQEYDGFFVFYEPTNAALIYRDDGVFYDLDSEDPTTGALQPYTAEIDTAQVFRWQGLLVDPLWWRSVWNTVTFSVVSGRAGNHPGHGRGTGLERQHAGPRRDPRRRAHPMGHSDHRVGPDVELDAE